VNMTELSVCDSDVAFLSNYFYHLLLFPTIVSLSKGANKRTLAIMQF